MTILNEYAQIHDSLDLTDENAHVLGKAFWNIVHLYHLGRKEQAVLLGTNPDNRKSLKDYESKQSIPLDPDKFFRVGLLLGIHKNLRILFPQNRKIVYNWFTTKQSLFHNLAPMDFIAQEPAQSLLRLATVRRALDLLRTSF
jgi:hypothetical protein